MNNMPERNPPKNGDIALLPATILSIAEKLVLVGSLSIFTDITGYKIANLSEDYPETQSKSK